MCLRGSFRRVSRTRRKSLRLEQLLLRRLWGNDVSRDGLEDLCCVVSQSQSIHSCGRWQLGGGKCFPLPKDGLHVAANEFCESHVLLSQSGSE
jgi:hypothetical protein